MRDRREAVTHHPSSPLLHGKGCMRADIGGWLGGESKREMTDDMVSRATVIASLLWGVALSLVALMWLLALLRLGEGLQRALVLTGVLSLAVAAVWQIRLYVLRLCALIRVGLGLESPDAELHSIGDSKSTR